MTCRWVLVYEDRDSWGNRNERYFAQKCILPDGHDEDFHIAALTVREVSKPRYYSQVDQWSLAEAS